MSWSDAYFSRHSKISQQHMEYCCWQKSAKILTASNRLEHSISKFSNAHINYMIAYNRAYSYIDFKSVSISSYREKKTEFKGKIPISTSDLSESFDYYKRKNVSFSSKYKIFSLGFSAFWFETIFKVIIPNMLKYVKLVQFTLTLTETSRIDE